MSRNGSGTYNLPSGNPVVTATTINSTWANTTLSDIATALTGSLAADGQTPATGNLNMNTNQIKNLATPTLSTDAVTKDYADALIGAGGVGVFSSVTSATSVTAASFDTTNFHISESGGKLLFKYGTTTIASLDSTGVFTTLSSVVGAGTP